MYNQLFKFKQQLTMWNDLGSPPDNFRYYKFTELSNDRQHLQAQCINLDDNKKNLFHNKVDHLSRVSEESFLKIQEEHTQNTINRPISSLKSTSKAKNTNKNGQHNSYELSNNCKNVSNKVQSKSLLQNSTKQKSSLLLSNKPSSISRAQINKHTHDKLKNKSNKSQKVINKPKEGSSQSFIQSINNQQDDISQIFISQINKTQEQMRKATSLKDKDKGAILLQTLQQIKEIQKQQLFYQKRMVKLVQEKSQISFLYDKEQKYDTKMSKNRKEKENRKSFKKNSEKSTIKKLGKSTGIEQRLSKIEQKCKFLDKKIDKCQHCNKGLHSTKLKKKSMSNLR